MANSPRNIGALLNAVAALRPAAQVAAAAFGLVGLEVDRESAGSMLWIVQTGAITGAPSATAIDSKLQHRNSAAESWTDVVVSPGNPAVAIQTITAADTLRAVRIDLSGFKRFIRPATTVAFTGGTSPAANLNQLFILDKLIET
jgi:hypothetical protein